MMVSLESVSEAEFVVALLMAPLTAFLCFWLNRPFGLWVIHSLLIQYLCLYWFPYPFYRSAVGLVMTFFLILVSEKRSRTASY